MKNAPVYTDMMSIASLPKEEEDTAVSIMLPLGVHISFKKEVKYRLGLMVQKTGKELEKICPPAKVKVILEKLENIVRNFQFDKTKRGAIIYVSPSEEKIIQVEVNLDEKVIIGNGFDIIGLCKAIKQENNYLVVLLTSKRVYTYLGHGRRLEHIKITKKDHIAAFAKDMPERTGNFSDPEERKEILLKKFLHHIDEALERILKLYPLPVFLLGTSKINGYFHQLTSHKENIAEYITHDFKCGQKESLIDVLIPYLEKWKKIQQRLIFRRLEEAAGAKKLVTGIKAVQDAVLQNRGQLLVVEENYPFAEPERNGIEKSMENGIHEEAPPRNKTIINRLIEQVLEGGGDVEFIEEGNMEYYRHIALIKFY